MMDRTDPPDTKAKGLPGLLQHYRYDAADRVVAAQPPNKAADRRFYLGSVLSNQQDGDSRRSYLSASGQLLGIREQGTGPAILQLFGIEQLGSVFQALSEGGSQHLAYTAHGEGADPSLPGFNGEQAEPVTGNYLLGNGYRAYNPTLMRFHNPDSVSPFGGGGLNAYAYCLGDPVNRTDPTGHISWQAGLGIGLGVLGVAYGGYALVFGGVAASSGLSAASAAVMVAGISGIGAAGAGIAQAAIDPGSAAASTLGWVSLGLGAASMLAGLAANHGSPANKLKPKQVSRMMEDSEGPQGPVAVPAVLQSSSSPLELLDDVAFRQMVRYLPGDDLVNLSLASTRLNGRVNDSVKRLVFGLDRADVMHHRAVWGGAANGYLPSQVRGSPFTRFAAHSLPMEADIMATDILQEHARLRLWKSAMHAKRFIGRSRWPTFTPL